MDPVRLVVVSLVVGLTTMACAQIPLEWTDTGLAGPPARQSHGMVYDRLRNEIVLFGGLQGVYRNDTWALGAGGWSQRSGTSAPSARANHAMAYDPIRERTVLFGGTNGADLADVWEWDGANWSLRANPVAGVGPFGAAAFDPMQGGTFYNRDSTNLLWDGVVATVVQVAEPLGGHGHTIVFDAASAGLVSSIGSYMKVFRPSSGWQEYPRNPAFALIDYAMANDPSSGRLLLQGGGGTVGSGNGSSLGYTWQWTGSVWSQVLGAEPLLGMHAMVFDHNRAAFVMFGGRRAQGGASDTTWVLTMAPAAAYGTRGHGCGPVEPRLRPDPLFGALPVLGGTSFLAIDGLVPGQWALGLIGVDARQWNGQNLPLDLTALGMPGCELLLAPLQTVSLGFGSPAGTARWTTGIPNRVALLGVEYFQQAVGMAPAANAAGVIWSNGGHGIVGLR